MNILRAIWAFLTSIFTNKPTPAVPPAPAQPLPVKPPIAPHPSLGSPLDQQTAFRQAIVQFCAQDVGQTEDKGRNRSALIDQINTEIGSELGKPYCIAGICIRGIKRTVKAMSLTLPPNFKYSPGTQRFFEKADPRYVRAKGELAKAGDVAIWQLKTDPTHGHAALVAKNQTDPNTFDSIQYNTSPGPDENSNGEGVHRKVASCVDGKLFHFRGFIDVAAWIVENQAKVISIGPK